MIPEHKVGIFRLQLFKQSEIFIAQQAEALERYKPIYIGRKAFGESPEGAVSLFSENSGGIRSAAAMVTRSPRIFSQLVGPHKPSLIHAHFGVDAVYALPLARALNVPLVTTLHGFDVTTRMDSFVKSGRPALLNYALQLKHLQKKGDLFICVSDYIRDQALNLGFAPDRSVVHYMGTTLPEERPASEAETTTIMHVARLVEKKGTAYLIRAAKIVMDAGIGFQLAIMGDGPLRASLEELSNSLGLSQFVKFHGTVPHRMVQEHLATAAMLVLPSVRAGNGDAEGLGMVLLEAAALGVPVVASQSGGIPEAVKDGVSGFLVPEGDVQALAERMMALLRDASLRKAMGAAGRKIAVDRFDVRAQGQKLESLYDSVLR